MPEGFSISASLDASRYREDLCVGFVIFCDENGLTKDQGVALAEGLGDALLMFAVEREGV